ncbi:hypothetical protein A7975_00015 [Bacillus sp. FJAT-26390]|nr:hypothetical protein A7975_00015 [Bacillus sp. FJAT-26390]
MSLLLPSPQLLLQFLLLRLLLQVLEVIAVLLLVVLGALAVLQVQEVQEDNCIYPSFHLLVIKLFHHIKSLILETLQIPIKLKIGK